MAKTPIFPTFFFLLIIYNTKFSDKFINRSILIFKITVFIAVIVSIIQAFDYSFMNAFPTWENTDKNAILSQGKYVDRRISIFGFVNLNELGLTYIPILSILTGFLVYNKKNIYYLLLILGGISAFLSNTRYVIIGFLLITIQIIVFYRSKLTGFAKYIVYVLIGFFIFSEIFNFFDYNIEDWYNQRLFAEKSFEKTTRYYAWVNFQKFFPRNPWFGIGKLASTDKEIVRASHMYHSSQIHVGYLAHLVSYGIIGSFFLFSFWILLARKLYKTAIRSNYWGSFFAFLILLWANFVMPTYYVFFYGLLFAFIFDKYFIDKYALKNT
jgi:hypothetical protein